MAKKAHYVNREYLLTDESVNVYGFRLLTSGFQQEEYLRNPIGYRMHNRDTGVVLRWVDFRQERDKIFAMPVINLSNPVGQQTLEEVENGFLNAASVGKIVVLEINDSEALKLEGQEGPTVTKWYPKEISLVDIPGNRNALAPSLYDVEGNEINLSDFKSANLEQFNNKFKNPLKLEQMEFKKAVIQTLNLADNVKDDAINQELKSLVSKASRVSGLERDLADLKLEKENVSKELSDFKAEINQEKIKDLLDAGQDAGKITAKIAKDLADKYADDAEGLKSLIDNLPSYASLTDKIDKANQSPHGLVGKSWDELDRSGKLPDLKLQDLDAFKEKYKEKFGKEYQEK